MHVYAHTLLQKLLFMHVSVFWDACPPADYRYRSLLSGPATGRAGDLFLCTFPQPIRFSSSVGTFHLAMGLESSISPYHGT